MDGDIQDCIDHLIVGGKTPSASRRANSNTPPTWPFPKDSTREVYSVVAQIPAGRVTTYGQIARLVGMPGYARRVGHALAAAPAGLPCHRVVNSAGRTAPHWTEQRPMLEAEGVRFRKNGCVDLTHSGWKEVTL